VDKGLRPADYPGLRGKGFAMKSGELRRRRAERAELQGMDKETMDKEA